MSSRMAAIYPQGICCKRRAEEPLTGGVAMSADATAAATAMRPSPRHHGTRAPDADGDRSGLRHDGRSRDHASIAIEHRRRDLLFLLRPAAGPSSRPIRERYLDNRDRRRRPAPEGTIYTCPMHPEIRQDGPGTCPICGMALEPEIATAEPAPNPELADMTRRFWIGAGAPLPVFVAGDGRPLSACTR